MTREEMVSIIEQNLPASTKAQVSRLEKDMADWKQVFRSCKSHKDVADAAMKLIPSMPGGEVPTSLALQYFLLGRRASNEPPSEEFLDRNIRMVTSKEYTTEQIIRKEVGPWMTAFRTSPSHGMIITAMNTSLIECSLMEDHEFGSGLVQNFGMQYFALGMRVGRIEKEQR